MWSQPKILHNDDVFMGSGCSNSIVIIFVWEGYLFVFHVSWQWVTSLWFFTSQVQLLRKLTCHSSYCVPIAYWLSACGIFFRQERHNYVVCITNMTRTLKLSHQSLYGRASKIKYTFIMQCVQVRPSHSCSTFLIFVRQLTYFSTNLVQRSTNFPILLEWNLNGWP